MTSQSFDYKPHVDGLRAVAVLLVVLYHVGIPGFSGGFIGVDVFFVISGYLITSLLLVEAEQRGRIDLIGFYARRVRRLFPALLVVVLATLLLGGLFLLPLFSEQSALARSAIATAFYLSNFYFWRYTGDYFDGPRDFEPLLHTWSLAVEEQFYLVWPLPIIALLAVRRNRETFRRDLLVLLAALSAVSFVFSVWATRTAPGAAFYLMPSRAWQFGVGGILGIWLAQSPRVGARVADFASGAGLAAIIGAGLVLTERGFPGLNALYPTLGAAAVIAGNTLNPRTPVAALLAWQPACFVGLVSYSWYLWHWPLLAITRAAALERESWPRDLALGGVSLVLAIVTYRLIENPIRRDRPGPFKAPIPTLWTGALISVLLAGSAVALTLNARRVAASDPRYVAVEIARTDVPILRHKCLHPLINRFQGLPDAPQCTYGNPANVRAILWGDSHADHLSGLMKAFADEHPDTGIIQRTFSSCRTYGDDPVKTTAALVQACEDFNAAVEQEVRTLHERGLTGVVISTMWNSVFRNPEVDRTPNVDMSPEYYAKATMAFEAVVGRLAEARLRVLIVGPFQLMPHEIPQCLARHSDAECAAERSSMDTQRQVSLAMLRNVASRHGEWVRLWDPIDALCDDKTCPANRGDTVLYTDALHLSATGGKTLLDSAREPLAWVTGKSTSAYPVVSGAYH